MSERPPVLAIRDARKAFGTRAALQGVTFDLHPGEFLALLGPNGAGKTTLIRALCGRTRLDAGDILVLGARAGDLAARARLGFVPQELALYSDLTARENLMIFGRLQGVAGTQLQERVEQALEWIGLADRATAFVRTFSGGMKRRLNVACAVLHRPQVLLLDEPTVGVDPQSRARIFEMIAELRADGTSILLTTHQLEDAEVHSDRILILDHGRIIAGGTLSELIASTIGPSYRAVVRLVHRPSTVVTGFQETADARTWAAAVTDPATEVPQLLARLTAAGCGVDDLHIQRPSLHDVFLHLTGRVLRE
ncbi:MAG: ABC transporter ATP-binding protein [Planctomycetes bacterium]|nr:ABC transporter ATP-binding protein [Planctomycetota bacterium]